MMNLFVKKPVDHIVVESQAGEHTLKKTLELKSSIALGIGAIIGAGLFKAAENHYREQKDRRL